MTKFKNIKAGLDINFSKNSFNFIYHFGSAKHYHFAENYSSLKKRWLEKNLELYDTIDSSDFGLSNFKSGLESFNNSFIEPKINFPCNGCPICYAFDEGKLLDIIEIDAASHTGVDNIREIIERAQFAPNLAKYKIYIIDEVHMLSKGAFNALLKILEEPPAHVKFILATTEVHKIPETILSRTQRYDFKRITLTGIIKRLDYIAEKEGVIAEKKALEYIANNSDGALRNAINQFEQFIINNEVKLENITKILGLTSQDELENILYKLLTKDKIAINDIEELYNNGKNIKLFIKDLLYFTKDKLLNKIGSEEEKSLIEILEELNSAYIKSKTSFDELTPFIIAVVKLISNHNYGEEVVSNKKVEPIKVGVSTTKVNNQENNFKKPEKKANNIENNIIEEKVENKQENNNLDINLDDIADIFGEDNIENIPQNEVSKIKENNNDFNNISGLPFEIKQLTAIISQTKGMAMVSSGLKQSNCDITSDRFIVETKTNLVYNKLNKAESIDIIKKGLGELGHNLEIEIKKI
ncbi:MAG: DNA polymerase III subunit gamma/tau [Candidatus Gracilibacteria bacterium]|nr:DNA polymerase III subunit gamma/tau [Candidatus Gracilibacteria bacterium]